MPPITTIAENRAAFEKVARREAGRASNGGIELKIQNLGAVFADVQLDLNKAVEGLPRNVSRLLARRIRDGSSEWRVKTGYSRSRFKGDERGIVNDASYAPRLEDSYGAAGDYVNDNVKRIAEDWVKKAVG